MMRRKNSALTDGKAIYLKRLPKFAYFPIWRRCRVSASEMPSRDGGVADSGDGCSRNFGCGWCDHPVEPLASITCGRGMECRVTLERRRASDARDSAWARNLLLRISRIPCLKKTAPPRKARPTRN